MGYHHLALAAKDINATHAFYEGILGFELVKVEVAPIITGGWGKHFFYRMDGDDSKFIAFWELNDVPNQSEHITNLNEATHLPPMTVHFSFDVASVDELHTKRDAWLAAGLNVLEIDHNWCHSIYTSDPDGNPVEFCVTTGAFTKEDRDYALATLNETEFKPSPKPALIKMWDAKKQAG
ncbi:MAG: VOC family protein [Alphaproteobacteria bacterium]|nr:MAG: VOC family protein [Alphaproteobacteria bacterium]